MSSPPTMRERILDSGANLLSKSGLAGVTVGSLAEQTGVSKSGLFAHFGSKEQLEIRLLDRTAEIAGRSVIAPAMAFAEGLPRLNKLVQQWLGWTKRAGLEGGCAVAAGLFELDDREGPTRDHLLAMENRWRDLLGAQVRRAIELNQLRHVDVDQFVWELCGIYLSHHASLRFVRDPKADERAATAYDALVERSLPATATGTGKPRPQKRSRK